MLDAWLAGDARRRRRLGRLMIAYGAVGLLILAAVTAGLGYASVRVGDIASRLDTQRDTMVRVLDSVALAIRSAGDSTERLDTTLTTSKTAISDGAALSRLLSEASRSIVGLGTVQILGQQPFTGLAASFGVVADQADALASSLDRTSTALEANASDVSALGDRLDDVSVELEDIRGTLQAVDLEEARAIRLAFLVLIALLVWLALPALIAIWSGRRLTRTDVDAFD